MNALAVTIDSFFGPHTYRGISEEATIIRNHVEEVHKDFSDSDSETLGKNYRETLKALVENSTECRTEDWDGNEAAATTYSDLVAASCFLSTLPTSFPVPEISVDPDGEFAFDWFNGERDVLTVSIGRDRKISYAARFGRTRHYGTEYFGDEIPPIITEHLERLFS